MKKNINSIYLSAAHKSSGKTIISDDYMQVLGAWFENDASFLSHVEILDKEKGFSGK